MDYVPGTDLDNNNQFTEEVKVQARGSMLSAYRP